MTDNKAMDHPDRADARGTMVGDREPVADDRGRAAADDSGTLHTDDLLRDDTRGRDGGVDQRQSAAEESRPALFADADTFRRRWEAIQAGFVDEPRRAVETADGLVAEVIQQLVRSFADERNQLEEQWSRGDQASTEDLRVALRRYRSFFDRLLSA